MQDNPGKLLGSPDTVGSATKPTHFVCLVFVGFYFSFLNTKSVKHPRLELRGRRDAQSEMICCSY